LTRNTRKRLTKFAEAEFCKTKSQTFYPDEITFLGSSLYLSNLTEN